MSIEIIRGIQSVTLPAGDYLVGDPCYAFPDHDKWMGWLHAADFENSLDFIAADGWDAVGVGTEYGDGEYADQHGNLYPVDAGLLGAVSVPQWVENGGRADDTPHGMRRVTFAAPFTVTARDEDGIVTIGSVDIFTGDADPVDDQDEPW